MEVTEYGGDPVFGWRFSTAGGEVVICHELYREHLGVQFAAFAKKSVKY